MVAQLHQNIDIMHSINYWARKALQQVNVCAYGVCLEI